MPDERKPEPADDKPHPKVFHIQIDREHYEVETAEMTGAQLRKVPPTPIPPERDLFEVVPGHPDRKIENDDIAACRPRRRARVFILPTPGKSSASSLRKGPQNGLDGTVASSEPGQREDLCQRAQQAV